MCEGIVPANSEVDISVVFCPTSFQTSTSKLQLSISQYLSQPLLCTVLGQSAPGLSRCLQCGVNAFVLVLVTESYLINSCGLA